MSTRMDEPQERCAFGIGCFSFPPRPRPSLTWGQHFRNLEAALANVGCREVQVHYDPSIDTQPIPGIAEPYQDMRSGGGRWTPGYAEFEFTVRVPFEFQEALEERRLTTEEYRVFCRNPYYEPVTFVVSGDPDDTSPSAGVRIVREFLADRLSGNTEVQFDFLGPSPFHADCYLRSRPSSSRDVLLECSRTRQRGYDRIEFRYPDSYAIDDALERLVDEAGGLLSLYYHFEALRGSEWADWQPISDLVDELVELYERGGLRAPFARIWKAGRLTNRAFIGLAGFERRLIEQEHYLRRSFQTTFLSPDDFFRDETEQQFQEMSKYPVKQLGELVGRIEDRRTGSVGNVLLLVATLLGIGLGAALTAWLT